ncbi:MAG: hypothetical protein AAF526_08175 [Pseudomonadota bacterium]
MSGFPHRLAPPDLGQVKLSLDDLDGPLGANCVKTHLTGGAGSAAEFDAKREDDQGSRLSAVL